MLGHAGGGMLLWLTEGVAMTRPVGSRWTIEAGRRGSCAAKTKKNMMLNICIEVTINNAYYDINQGSLA